MNHFKYPFLSALYRSGIYPALKAQKRKLDLIRKRPHDSDFRFFSYFSDSPGLFLDIGANSGQSAVSFRIFNRKAKILSIEPNPFLESDLKRVKSLIGDDFSYRICGAGSEASELELWYPEIHGFPITQDATCSPEMLESLRSDSRIPRNFKVRSVKTRIHRLDDWNLDPKQVRFIKLDIQGFEYPALLGMRGLLEKANPIVLIERCLGFEKIRDFLAGLGFEGFIYSAEETCLKRIVSKSSDDFSNCFFLRKPDLALLGQMQLQVR